MNLDPNTYVGLLFVGMSLLWIVAMNVVIFWSPARVRSKALDVLKAYAEKGREPPPELVEALIGDTEGKPRRAPADHLARAGAGLVLAAGLSAIGWWLIPDTGEAALKVIVAFVFLVALIAAADSVGRLVWTISQPKHRDR